MKKIIICTLLFIISLLSFSITVRVYVGDIQDNNWGIWGFGNVIMAVVVYGVVAAEIPEKAQSKLLYQVPSLCPNGVDICQCF